MRWGGGGMRGKRRDLVPMGSCVQRGTYLRVRDGMCVTVHARLLPQHPQWPPRPPHTPAAPSGGGRSLSGPWCCRSFRLSNQSDLPRLPTPRPYPLHPLHRKWAGPGVLVSACSARQPSTTWAEGAGARPWGDGCGPSSGEKQRERVPAPCPSQVKPTLPWPCLAWSPGSQSLPPDPCHQPWGWR